jgi:hypothetical protein
MPVYYHFCSRWEKPRALQEGGMDGDVHLSLEEGFKAPWFTSDSSWSVADRLGKGRHPNSLHRADLRIAVRFKEGDPNLLTWDEVCTRFSTTSFWQDHFKKNVYGCGEGWFVYMKTISPSQIVSVEERPGAEPLDLADLTPEIVVVNYTGAVGQIGREVEKKLKTEDLLAQYGHWVRRENMQYPWSDMPKPLLRKIASVDPAKAVEEGVRFAEKIGVNLSFLGTKREDPALLTMAGVARWLHGDRKLVDISVPSATMLGEMEPRFSSLPYIEREPWKKSMCLRLADGGFGARGEFIIYVEPLSGLFPGVSYVIWTKDLNKRWATVVSKRYTGGLPHYTQMQHEDGTESSLGLLEDGARIKLDKLRNIAVNVMAVFNVEPKLIIGRRKAPRSRGRTGGAGKIKRLTLDDAGVRLITRRWFIEPLEEDEGPVEPIVHATHSAPAFHTVDPHYSHWWVRNPLPGEETAGSREVTNKDGSTTIHFRVKRLRGRKGSYGRGDELRPKQRRLVTGIDDIGGK